MSIGSYRYYIHAYIIVITQVPRGTVWYMSTHLAVAIALMSFHLQTTLSDPHLCLILHLHATTLLPFYAPGGCWIFHLTTVVTVLFPSLDFHFTAKPAESVTWRNEVPFGATFAKFSMEYVGTCVHARRPPAEYLTTDKNVPTWFRLSARSLYFAPRPPLSRLIWYGRMTKDARDYCVAARRETHPECGRYPARVSPLDDKMTGDETGPQCDVRTLSSLCSRAACAASVNNESCGISVQESVTFQRNMRRLGNKDIRIIRTGRICRLIFLDRKR